MWNLIFFQLFLQVILAGEEEATTAEPQEPTQDVPAAPEETGDDHASWGYPSENAAWGGLCETGQEQSPIDLPTFNHAVDNSRSPMNFTMYSPKSVWAHDNGHSMKWDFGGLGSTMLNGELYTLSQLHVHTASEHTVDGAHADLEVHFVHTSASGGLAVIGVMCYTSGVFEDAFFDALVSSTTAATAVNPTNLFNTLDNKKFYQYDGSLTTPPCSEDVFWTVMASRCRVPNSFMDLMNSKVSMDGNFRATQPLNGRTISGVIVDFGDDDSSTRNWESEAYAFLVIIVIFFGFVLIMVIYNMVSSGTHDEKLAYDLHKDDTVEMTPIDPKTTFDAVIKDHTEDYGFFAPINVPDKVTEQYEDVKEDQDDEEEDLEENFEDATLI